MLNSLWTTDHSRDYFWIEENGTLLRTNVCVECQINYWLPVVVLPVPMVSASAGEIRYIVPSTVNVHRASVIIYKVV